MVWNDAKLTFTCNQRYSNCADKNTLCPAPAVAESRAGVLSATHQHNDASPAHSEHSVNYDFTIHHCAGMRQDGRSKSKLITAHVTGVSKRTQVPLSPQKKMSATNNNYITMLAHYTVGTVQAASSAQFKNHKRHRYDINMPQTL